MKLPIQRAQKHQENKKNNLFICRFALADYVLSNTL